VRTSEEHLINEIKMQIKTIDVKI